MVTLKPVPPVEQYGSPRFLGSPLVPLPRSRTPAAPVLLCHYRNQVLSPHTKQRRPQRSTNFRGSITRLQHSLSTLPASDFPTLARLASGGWQTLTGWDLNPLDSKANFRYGGYPPYYPNAPGLAWRHLCLRVRKSRTISSSSRQFLDRLQELSVELLRPLPAWGSALPLS